MLWKQARAALESRQYQKSQSLFGDFIKRHFNDERVPEARIYVGICDYRIGGRTARALDAWNRVVNMELMQKRASPALLLGLEQLAAHHRTQHDWREHEKTLEHLVGKFPDAPSTHREHAQAGRMRLEQGDYAAAAALYGKVSEHLKGDDLLNYDISKELSSPESSVPAILISADKHLTSDNVPMAVRLYEEVLKRNPDMNQKHEAMTKLGWCLYVDRELSKAERLWKEVVKNAPAGDQWRGRSRWHLAVLNAGYYNKPDQAIELCEIQAKEFPNSFLGQQALFSKAWLYWTQNEWKKAKLAFEDLIRAFPEKAAHPPILKYIRDCEDGMKKTR